MTALLTERKAITLKLARQIIDRAEQAAQDNGVDVVIAIMDGGGNLISLSRMDQAPIGSVLVAQQKARSSVIFKSKTKEFESWLKSGAMGVLTLDVIPFEGGVPIIVEGNIIGAVGVSGGTAAQDGAVAEAGAAIVEALSGLKEAP